MDFLLYCVILNGDKLLEFCLKLLLGDEIRMVFRCSRTIDIERHRIVFGISDDLISTQNRLQFLSFLEHNP